MYGKRGNHIFDNFDATVVPVERSDVPGASSCWCRGEGWFEGVNEDGSNNKNEGDRHAAPEKGSREPLMRDPSLMPTSCLSRARLEGEVYLLDRLFCLGRSLFFLLRVAAVNGVRVGQPESGCSPGREILSHDRASKRVWEVVVAFFTYLSMRRGVPSACTAVCLKALSARRSLPRFVLKLLHGR